MIFRRTPNVPPLADYRDLYLRPDFQHRCAYCLTHEFYFLQGAGGEIDHHRPLHATGQDFSHLRSIDSNLYWTCGQCNLEKGDLWRSDEEYAGGLRFLDPCAEDHDAHWDTHTDGRLTAKTDMGRHTILNIRLDRKRLTDLRCLLYTYQQKVAAIEDELNRRRLSPEQRTILLAHLADIKPFVDPPVFER